MPRAEGLTRRWTIFVCVIFALPTVLPVTAANMNGSGALGTGAGLGSARMALLEMAGYNTQGEVEKKEENIEYSGKVVSFDDICWKT